MRASLAGAVPSPKVEPLELSDVERQVLRGWSRRRKSAQALAVRSRIVLACAQPETAISRIWRAFGLKPHLVETWKLSPARVGVRSTHIGRADKPLPFLRL